MAGSHQVFMWAFGTPETRRPIQRRLLTALARKNDTGKDDAWAMKKEHVVDMAVGQT